jgi:Response regulator containing CheY-like receiver, AAA-type ATPase, and DNA-binding domains
VPHQAREEKISILVVDDEPVVGDALKLVLESSGYEVVLVEKGREGITQAGNRRFRLAIIDLFLSDISGLRAIKTIREQQPEILIIMITGRGNPQAFSVARRLGVVGILAKPFRPADILQLITTNLAR